MTTRTGAEPEVTAEHGQRLLVIYAALMLAMGAPLCFFLWEGITRWYRWFFLLLIPVIVHAVLMSYSRGAMLSLVVACPLLWWRSRRKLLLTLIYAAVAAMIPVLACAATRTKPVTYADLKWADYGA